MFSVRSRNPPLSNQKSEKKHMTRKSNKPEEILRSGKSGNDERSISRAKKQIENEPGELK